MKPNSHKYLSKNIAPENCPGAYPLNVNVSRSIGYSGNWIGCGCIEKTGVGDNHKDIHFPFYSLVYVVRGSGKYIDENGVTHGLQSGSLFQRRPELRHTTAVTPESDWLEYYFDCNTEYFNHLVDIGVLERDVAVYQLRHDPSLCGEFDKLIEEISNADEGRLADILLRFLSCTRSLVNQGRLHQETGDSRRMIEKACLDFRRFVDRRLDMKEYCRENGFGYESFRKEFKKVTGVSPGKYLVRKRMDRACHILRSTSKSIFEISVLLGYKSQYEFSNQFKKQFGVYPKHFRDGIREY